MRSQLPFGVPVTAPRTTDLAANSSVTAARALLIAMDALEGTPPPPFQTYRPFLDRPAAPSTDP